jgi:hypothetical protein
VVGLEESQLLADKNSTESSRRETMVSVLCLFGRERIYMPSSRDLPAQKNQFLFVTIINCHKPRGHIFRDGCRFCSSSAYCALE